MLDIFKKMIGDKADWKLYKKRVNELPEDYKNAMDGIQTYMFNFAGGPAMMEVLYGLIEKFEESASDGRKVSDIVGNDIGAFCEDIFKAVPEATWVDGHKKKIQDKINKKINKQD